jgi:undecaprenyl-diphosphatase
MSMRRHDFFHYAVAIVLAALFLQTAARAQTATGETKPGDAARTALDGGAPETAAFPPPPAPVPTPSSVGADSQRSHSAVDTPLAANSPTRRVTLVPHPLQPEPAGGIKFSADPVGDAAVLTVAVGFAATSELILSTGEIRPQQIDPNFQTSSLLGIDRGAISQHVDPNASTFSTVGLGVALGFAVLHPIASGFKRGREAFLVDAIMYAETMSIAWGVDDLAKIAVRRPRPIAYIDRNIAIANGTYNPATYNNTSTDSSLSFYSGHVTEVAAITGTATYLMFARYGAADLRPWITAVAGSGLTTFVGIERVRAGAHFPTDVIAGAMAGVGIGVLVPHLHRADSIRQRPVWVGFTPAFESRGGTVTLGGRL